MSLPWLSVENHLDCTATVLPLPLSELLLESSRQTSDKSMLVTESTKHGKGIERPVDGLFSLLAELRNMIYDLVLHENDITSGSRRAPGVVNVYQATHAMKRFAFPTGPKTHRPFMPNRWLVIIGKKSAKKLRRLRFKVKAVPYDLATGDGAGEAFFVWLKIQTSAKESGARRIDAHSSCMKAPGRSFFDLRHRPEEQQINIGHTCRGGVRAAWVRHEDARAPG